MHIRPIDLDNDAEKHAFYLAFRTAELAENPARPVWSEADLMVMFTDPDDAEEPAAFGAFHDGPDEALLGGAFSFYPLLDNTGMVYSAVFVAPEHQGHGLGSELLRHLVSEASARGRSTVIVGSMYSFSRRDDHGFRRFAERHGFTLANFEINRRLELPVPNQQLQVWADEAAPHHGDYRIETFNDMIPDELLPSYCHVVNQLVLDAPTGDLDLEAEQVTPEVWRQRQARNAKVGLHRYDTVAIDASGDVVAVTTLALPSGDEVNVHQWATIVLRGHRGHRLGLAIKTRNLQVLQQSHPERSYVFTSNSEDNGHMVEINERMGFEPLELVAEFQRKLA